jgi:3-oxoacyl-[acyl-carrier protein] reductase
VLRDALSLTGRVALVTGGSRGIGRAIAIALAESGASVAVAYRQRDDQAREVLAAIESAGGRAFIGRCNVRDESEVSAFVARTAEALGPVDILVNNAGVTRDGHILFSETATWDDVLGVNLDAAYYAVRAVVRGMLLRRWGRIINVSSPSARMPLSGQTSYAASKAGIEGFTRALSRDLAAKGVLVTRCRPA